MAVLNHIDPETLLQDALQTLQAEIQTLKNDADDVTIVDREEWSKRLDRAIRALRGMVKEAREIQLERKEMLAGASEAELAKAVLDEAAGITVMVEGLRERGWVCTPPHRVEVEDAQLDGDFRGATKKRGKKKLLMNAMIPKKLETGAEDDAE